MAIRVQSEVASHPQEDRIPPIDYRVVCILLSCPSLLSWSRWPG